VSFILDALRKSEHERQRNTGPGLAEVPVVAPRPRSNVWATAAVALLVVNLVAVGVLMLRRAQKDEAPAAAASAATAPTAPTAGVAAAQPPGTGSAANPMLAPVTQAPATPTSPPPLEQRGAPVDPGRNPLAAEIGGGSPAGLDPAVADGAAAVRAGPPAVMRKNPVRPGSVVYAPVPEATDGPYTPPAAAPAAAPAPAAEAMPTADEVTARGGLPELHLDLHVYATSPQQRFIFVNSRKYREGETLQEGPLIEQITPDGAVLNFRGSRFKLSND
jgi:general secretion pathway protein B